MKFTRRQWLKTAAASAALAAIPQQLSALTNVEKRSTVSLDFNEADFTAPMFNLHGQISSPVIIESIELLKNGSNYFVRTRSKDGAEGLIGTKQIIDFLPIFERLIAPHFIGKDARDIETLVDSVYRANYKLAGLALWCPVAYVEQSVLDMLGKIARKPVGELLGGVWRNEIPVYLSGSARELTAEEEIAIYARGVEETGAKSVKFKIGGRMQKYDPYPNRTKTLLELSRKQLGNDIILAADANGSYTVKEAIEVGRMLESLNYSFFEEPCPFQLLSDTQAVAKALNIPIAAGEQDSSLWLFWWGLKNHMMSIVQPDINYNGGLIRTIRVARLAERMGINIVPHNTQTRATSVNILQFASCTKNALPMMEYPWRKSQETPSWYTPDFKIVDGKIKVPTTPGMGLEIDPGFIAKAERIAFINKSDAKGNVSGSGSSN
ncbi:MAG: mandelate racemase/muconate lactonizing enzyme family protein [Prevotellaceae bacterium]|jgi:L-alanine-DL-glutamate epimerase-like enolase superfamily enzyme|nr:mandelate racemase/muconate lactonizing enzyme family protein [Prevotellaceae bacterium]